MNGPHDGEENEQTRPIDVVGARDRVLDALVGFCRALRSAGVAVPPNATITAARALVTVGFDDKERVRAALRASLVSRHADLDAFERLFPEFWRRLTAGLAPTAGGDTDSQPQPDDPRGWPAESVADAGDDDSAQDDRSETTRNTTPPNWTRPTDDTESVASEPTLTARYSPTGRSKPLTVDFDADAELDRAIRRLTRAIEDLDGRRWDATGTERVDARRALRESISTGGTVVSLPRQDHTEQTVRAVLLVDVSRSVLDSLDRRFLVRFLYAATAAWPTSRVFFFDTSVREVTEPFRAPTATAALAALQRAETEWGGGTRIGAAIHTIKREHDSAIDRRTTVFLVSDGLETGAIDRLEAGMAWLSHDTRRTLWLNPLAGASEYEPTARGIAAALPYVTGLFAFRGPSDLEEIARQLELDRRSIGYEHDPRRIDTD